MLLEVGSGRIGRNSFRKANWMDVVVQLVIHRPQIQNPQLLLYWASVSPRGSTMNSKDTVLAVMKDVKGLRWLDRQTGQLACEGFAG